MLNDIIRTEVESCYDANKNWGNMLYEQIIPNTTGVYEIQKHTTIIGNA